MDVRIYLTDPNGDLLESPWSELGWDGSGRRTLVKAHGPTVPYKIIFYNGHLPDCSAIPGLPGTYAGDIPINTRPDPFHVENISPRVYSVSIKVGHNSRDNFSID